MIGSGHGAAFLRARALALIAAGAPLVAIDPDPANLRARRSYARAGFAFEAIVETGDGPAALMIFRP
jgi:aminoglycoside 6'-N-acetyltransferase